MSSLPAAHAAQIPSLNGLRAIAVLIVFIGHGTTTTAGPLTWPGHTGVTIFFFLSGYLITTLLRREYEKTNSIALPRFYLRRALRILPPAYLAIATSLILAQAGLLPHNGITPAAVLAELLNYTNYYLIVAGRTGLPPETSMLWSLAVEEHFYLLFPAALLLIYRRRNRTTIAYILLTACALAPLYRIALHLSGASFLHLYTSTDTRFDSILFGAALALLANPALGDRPPLRLKPETLTRAAPVALLVFIASTQIPSTFFRLTLADTVQCLCLIPIFWLVITKPGTNFGKVLNHRVVAHLGVLSFSIYLFHRMALALVTPIALPAPATDLVALALTLAVAQVVYVTLERPLGRLRKRLETPRPPRR